MVTLKETVEQVKRDLLASNYICKRIIDINLKLEQIENEMVGLKAIDYSKEKGSSSKENKIYKLMDEKADLINQRNILTVSLMMRKEILDKIEDEEARQLIIERYVCNYTLLEMTKLHRYSISRIYEKIEENLKKSVKPKIFGGFS